MPLPLAHMSKSLKNAEKLLMKILDEGLENQILLSFLTKGNSKKKIERKFKPLVNITTIIWMCPPQIEWLKPYPKVMVLGGGAFRRRVNPESHPPP